MNRTLAAQLSHLALLVALVFSVACRAPNGDVAETDLMPTEPAPSGPTATDEVCDAFEARPEDPEVFVGPEGLEGRLLAAIASADHTVDVLMYQMRRGTFVDAFVEAETRGVEVRLLLDADQWVSGSAEAELLAAGVELRNAPHVFTHAHSKVLIIDREAAIIMSGNLTSNTMNSARNYGAYLEDPEDVADINSIFDADWTGMLPAIDCTRLVVSPTNSKSRVLELINSAQANLDLELMYVTEYDVLDAIAARAAQGVEVRVLLADPGIMGQNYETINELEELGIPVRVFDEEFVHAKLIIADGVALVGSQNMSYTSLTLNREVGIMVSEPGPASQIMAQFEADWSAGYVLE